jgi:hypothetical protein
MHRDHAFQYDRLESVKKREDYFKKYGVRWYAFACLPYFDAVRMTIIDPMHNLLMGELRLRVFSLDHECSPFG